MNYKIENETYIANDGYVFENKTDKTLCKGLKLGINDTIENYEVIEEPVIEEVEPTYEELLEMYKKENS